MKRKVVALITVFLITLLLIEWSRACAIFEY
jgi:hypothetical protein